MEEGATYAQVRELEAGATNLRPVVRRLRELVRGRHLLEFDRVALHPETRSKEIIRKETYLYYIIIIKKSIRIML